jgi:DNA sulfur modification protein DndD
MNLNQAIGRLKEKRSSLEDRIEEFQQQIRENDRKLASLEEEISIADSARKQADLCKRLRSILQEYLKAATGRRVATLQRNVEQMLKRLARKEDLVTQLSIDPKDYSVTLIDARGEQIRKGGLSAGEKEIYAICLLWGLAKTSGRELPIVIDTPLSRLDSDHRRAIVQKYYPEASRQVIILSTDTEIDKEYYRLLEPNIDKAYLLDYDQGSGRTRVKSGYFWVN